MDQIDMQQYTNLEVRSARSPKGNDRQSVVDVAKAAFLWHPNPTPLAQGSFACQF